MSDSKNPLRSVGALLLTAAALTCSEAVAHAQPTTSGKETLCMDTGRNITFAAAVSLDNSGNTYVTGGKRLNDHDKGVSRGSTITTIKYGADGVEVWSRSYQGPFGCFDHGRGISTDHSGNVYVTGTVWLRGNDPADPFVDRSQRAYATIKYDGDGTVQWVNQYFIEGDQKDEPRAIVLDDRGDVYVTGLGDSGQGGPRKEIATVKYDGKDGTQLWEARYGGPRGVLSTSGMAFSVNGLYVGATVCMQVTQKGNCPDFAYEVPKFD